MRTAAVARLTTDRDAVMACEDNLSFMRPLKSGSMQLIVTSPPYNIGKAYERRKSSGLDRYINDQAAGDRRMCPAVAARPVRSAGRSTYHVQNGEVFPARHGAVPRLQGPRPEAPQSVLSGTLNTGSTVPSAFQAVMKPSCGSPRATITSSTSTPIRVPSKYPGKKHFKGPTDQAKLSGNPLGKNPGDVWIFPNVKNNHVEKTIHPCQFPVETRRAFGAVA